MSTRADSFPLYYAQHLQDTEIQSLPWQAEHIYTRLRMTQWMLLGHDDDSAVLASRCRMTVPDFEQWWPYVKHLFPICSDGRRRNLDLEEIRAEVAAKFQRRSAAGKANVASRYQSYSVAPSGPTNGSQSLSNGSELASIGSVEPTIGSSLQSQDSPNGDKSTTSYNNVPSENAPAPAHTREETADDDFELTAEETKVNQRKVYADCQWILAEVAKRRGVEKPVIKHREILGVIGADHPLRMLVTELGREITLAVWEQGRKTYSREPTWKTLFDKRYQLMEDRKRGGLPTNSQNKSLQESAEDRVKRLMNG